MLSAEAAAGTILVVEHDTDLANLLRLRLTRAGHAVVPAGSLQQALDALEAGPVDVVLLAADLGGGGLGGGGLGGGGLGGGGLGGGGPGGGGLSALTHLRRVRPGLPAILLTGLSPDATTAVVASGEAHLSKPFTGPALLSLVQELLHQGRHGDAPRAREPVNPLPAAAATAPPAARERPAAPTGARVLVVDDEADLRELLTRALTLLGHEVITAASGRAAIQTALEQPVDVVLLDLDMPDIDGHGVLRALRADPRTAAVPVILLTARHQGSDVAQGFARGAVDFIRKPFSMVEVRARLEVALTRAKVLGGLTDLRDAIVPDAPHDSESLIARVLYQPAAEAVAGGDLHAVLDGPGGSTFAVLGDVGGHGPATASMAAHLRAVIANHAGASAGPGELLRAANLSVCAAGNGVDGIPVLVTMAVVQLDPVTGRVRCALAGHPPVLLLPLGTPLVDVAPCLPLGVDEGEVYVDGSTHLGRTDGGADWALLLYSDGLLEGRRAGSPEMFGDAALARALAGLPPRQDPAAILSSLLAAHSAFVAGAADDDLTLLVLAPTPAWGGG